MRQDLSRVLRRNALNIGNSWKKKPLSSSLECFIDHFNLLNGIGDLNKDSAGTPLDSNVTTDTP